MLDAGLREVLDPTAVLFLFFSAFPDLSRKERHRLFPGNNQQHLYPIKN